MGGLDGFIAAASVQAETYDKAEFAKRTPRTR